MFRHLYWVVEEGGGSAEFCVTGIYTSIHDLLETGIRWVHGGSKMRLSLVKVDHSGPPLGTWLSPDFAGLDARLQEFVATQEFSVSEILDLQEGLKKFFN